MKIKKFFLNCLNRRSFHFLSFIGCITIILPTLLWLIYSKLIYSGNNIFLDTEPAFFIFGLLILPTFGLATIIATIIIYIKLLIREDLDHTYRIQNKFLSTNLIYGLFVSIFFSFAVYIITISTFLIVSILRGGMPFGLLLQKILIPFISYIVILLFAIIRI